MHRRIVALILLLSAFHTSAAPADAATTAHYTFSSGHRQVALLELYTSEGCSSCPPAEAWYSKLLKRPDLWSGIVPLAFHVDYWDDLGWKDPYSTADNSRRQRRYKAEGGVRSVYTPGFVLNGQEWRGWFTGQDLPASDTPAGSLNVEVAGGMIHAWYESAQNTPEPLELQVALLGFDLTTHVPRGENRGRNLTHQFAVLAQAEQRSDENQWTLAMPTTDRDPARLALAAWITRPGRQRPLQATGGWLH